MAQFQKTLFTSKFDACMYHAMILNVFMGNRFTHSEIEVIAALASSTDMFSLESRKKIKKDLELSDAGLTNYISSLKRKGAVIMKDNKPILLPLFLVDPKENEYQIKTVIEA